MVVLGAAAQQVTSKTITRLAAAVGEIFPEEYCRVARAAWRRQILIAQSRVDGYMRQPTFIFAQW